MLATRSGAAQRVAMPLPPAGEADHGPVRLAHLRLAGANLLSAAGEVQEARATGVTADRQRAARDTERCLHHALRGPDVPTCITPPRDDVVCPGGVLGHLDLV